MLQEVPETQDGRGLHCVLLLQAHKSCGTMSEIEAKVRYVKLARSLKTYGVSFFLVKVRCGLLWGRWAPWGAAARTLCWCRGSAVEPLLGVQRVPGSIPS